MSAAEKLEPPNSTQIAAKLEELPTLPTVVYELSRVINNPMSSIGDVEKIMSNDQSLTTKVLKLSNSAYYAVPGGVSNLRRAITCVGYGTVHQLALSASIVQALKVRDGIKFDMREFWKHSLGVAIASESIAKDLGHRSPPDLFTCGLVHDMGKIGLLMVAEDVFMATLAYAQEKSISVYEAEGQLSYPRHSMVGNLLSQKWKLPHMIQAAAGQHHVWEAAARQRLSQEVNFIVDIVFLANRLIHALDFGNSGYKQTESLPRELLGRLGIQPEQLRDMTRGIRDKLSRADEFLSIIGGA